MAIGRYAVVSNGVVINIVMWDSDKKGYAPPEGSLIKIPEDQPVAIGDGFDKGKFTPPPPPPVSIIVSKGITAIEAEYQQLCSSVFVSQEQREAMRVVAVDAITRIKQVQTLGEASALVAQATTAMRQYVQEALT